MHILGPSGEEQGNRLISRQPIYLEKTTLMSYVICGDKRLNLHPPLRLKAHTPYEIWFGTENVMVAEIKMNVEIPKVAPPEKNIVIP